MNEPTKQRPGDQVLPSGDGECVQDRIIEAMQESKRVGIERYGTTLRTFNGRRGLQDAAEEARDLYVYLTQLVMEAEAALEKKVELATEALLENIPGLSRLAARAVAEQVVLRLGGASDAPAETITIPRPAIHTGPQHKTVDEATADYLLEAATRVVDRQIWGSGVTALVARLLTDAAMALQGD